MRRYNPGIPEGMEPRLAHRLRKLLRPFLSFVVASMVTAALGSVAQTQLNLQRLTSLGQDIELPLRMRSTLADLLNFAPLWALLVAVAFALAFPVARVLQRWTAGPRWLWFPLAGGVAILVTLMSMKLALGITAIAAARTDFGVFLLCLSGLVGGWVQARYGRSQRLTKR